MAANLFPEQMLSSEAMSLETIAGRLKYYSLQLHLLHWQTSSYSEHKALDELYGFINGFTDGVLEKLMGYIGRRPKAFKIRPLSDTIDSKALVKEISDWSYKLYLWAGENDYCDVENMAQELSGEANKTLYLLTLS